MPIFLFLLSGQCQYPLAANGTACTDNNPCTSNDVCTSGTCSGIPISCPAPAECKLAGVCNVANGQCTYANKADGSTCNDGNPCTKNDQCTAGTCAGTAVVCPLGQCQTSGSCNVATGQCVYTNATSMPVFFLLWLSLLLTPASRQHSLR